MENSINPQTGPPERLVFKYKKKNVVKEDVGDETAKNQANNSNEKAVAKDMGSRWCPEEIEIFFNCKLNMALSHKIFDLH